MRLVLPLSSCRRCWQVSLVIGVAACGPHVDDADAGGASDASETADALDCEPTCDACDFTHRWSTTVAAFDVQGVAAMPGGGFVVTGLTAGPVDFGGGPLPNGTSISTVVARFGADGEHVWSRVFDGLYIDGAMEIATGPSSEIAIVGFMGGAQDFGGGPREGAVYVAVLDADGGHVYSHGFAASDTNYPGGDDLAFDAAGKLVVVGDFIGTIDVGAGPMMSAVPNETAGMPDSVWIAAFDPAGDLSWGRALTTGKLASPRVAFGGSGEVFVAASCEGTVQLGDVSMSAPDGGMFVARFDAAGNPIDGRVAVDYRRISPGDIATDASGDVFVTGVGGFMPDFGEGPLDGDGMFLARYDADLELQWARSFGGASWGGGLAITDDLSVAVISRSGGTDFGGGPLPKTDSQSGVDIAIAMFDPCGSHLWSASYGPTQEAGGGRIAFLDGGDLVVTGAISTVDDPVDFGGGPLFEADGGSWVAVLRR